MEYKYRLELRGAMADGATPEEAVVNAQEVIEHWIAFACEHGREVPEPEALAAHAR
jgi:predicted RNase H-like HicB family nuclease